MDKAEDIISALFNKAADKESLAFVNVHKQWREILQDERLADHCRLEDLDGSSIRISFDHPGWIQVFRMNESMILKRLNSRYSNLNVSNVILYLKDDKFPEKRPAPVKKAEREENSEDVKDMRGDLDSIKDDDLKLKLENLRKKLEEG